jgi:hypothetical protein
VPINATNPFKGRQYSGEVILTAVRWYLRYPMAYEHVSELLDRQRSREIFIRFSHGSCVPLQVHRAARLQVYCVVDLQINCAL